MGITLTMLGVGMLLGFLGAGGSGVIISLLTVLFGVPIHMALGTALGAMIFSSLSGTFSHYREGNISFRTGIIVGAFGAVGALISSKFTEQIPSSELKWMTAGLLFLSGLILWLRMFIVAQDKNAKKEITKGVKFFCFAMGIGLITGGLSGLFGIGSTPFIQIGLMAFLQMPVKQAAGTTMLVILPIAIAGGAGYYQIGFLDFQLLLQVVSGTMIGSYIGAKFTKRVPLPFLKTSMVLFPMIGGAILLMD